MSACNAAVNLSNAVDSVYIVNSPVEQGTEKVVGENDIVESTILRSLTTA